MKNHWTTRTSLPRTRSTRGAFTLVEILVALGVMMLLLVIILVPVNMGLDLFHIGKTRSEVQQANQLVINQLASELRQAVHVFPNEEMPGIANQPPYNDAGTPVSNTARIDFLLPAVSDNGSVLTPPRASTYKVTYYARRLDSNKNYDVYSNPIVLWRAQYPSTASNTKDQTKGEPIQLSTASDFDSANPATASASHTQITPRDMVLIAPNADLPDTNPAKSHQPDSSFICDDSNNDGKIDRVSISLLLAKYDSIGAAGEDKNQQIRLTRTVELPNVK